MKRGTPRHPKIWNLATALGVTIPTAVGIMEMLWHFTAEVTPQGDIGSAKDQQILEAVHWKRKTPDLIATLVAEKLLDRDPEYRLIVHDWPDHADNSVKKWLQRHEKDFLPVYRKKSGQSTDMVPDSVSPSRVAEAEAGQGNGSEGGVGEDPLEQIELWLQQYMQHFGIDWGKPDKGLCRKVLRAMNGASLDELEKLLEDLWRRKEKPQKSYAWFVTVTHDRFEGRKDAAGA